MPFTPFHLGPAIFFGILMRKHVHMPTFLIANVILDLEPFLVMVLGLRYPLHGYFHTFIIGFIAGLSIGLLMFLLEKHLSSFYRKLLLEPVKPSLKSFMLAGPSGTMLHVLLDSPLYGDINPLYPLAINPFYNLSITMETYLFCQVTGFIGVAVYFCLIVLLIVLKARKS